MDSDYSDEFLQYYGYFEDINENNNYYFNEYNDNDKQTETYESDEDIWWLFNRRQETPTNC